MTQVVNETTSDDCKCACSLEGCCAITAMLKKISNCQHMERFLFTTWLVNLLDIAKDGWNIVPANVVRILTFERLELTHTCCVWQGNQWFGDDTTRYFAAFDDGERAETQDEESENLNKLAVLMLEFEHAYIALGVPLPEFLKGYWRTRMDEVMSGEEAIDEDEVRRIRELGVTWEPLEQRGTHSYTSSTP